MKLDDDEFDETVDTHDGSLNEDWGMTLDTHDDYLDEDLKHATEQKNLYVLHLSNLLH